MHRHKVVLLAMVALLFSSFGAFSPAGVAQGLSCTPLDTGTPVPDTIEVPDLPEVEVPDGATEVRFGYIPLSIYAPIFVAYEKGYFAEYGIDLQLEPLPGGTDMVLMASTGELDMAMSGIGPAFWNAANQGIGVEVVSPGHMEGNPVASPLMISKKACEDGSITSVADLAGKRVAVNAPGATELWLDIALETGGLSIEDVDLQYMSFPDAVVALDSGSLDASIIGEPLATQAEQQGLAVRLAYDFPVEGIQPTMMFGNTEWMAENPELAAGVIAGYIRASRDLMENFNDPVNLAIIQKYTEVPPELIAASVKPVYSTDGAINVQSLDQLQVFFGERGLLEYDEMMDPTNIINPSYVVSALELIDP
jgi:NitT/TauT family transport system substrate-binding protein